MAAGQSCQTRRQARLVTRKCFLAWRQVLIVAHVQLESEKFGRMIITLVMVVARHYIRRA